MPSSSIAPATAPAPPASDRRAPARRRATSAGRSRACASYASSRRVSRALQVLARGLGQPHARGDVEGRELAAPQRGQRLEVGLAHAGDVAGEQAVDRAAQERLAERLGAARAERHAAQQERAVVAEQRVVLRLVRQHRRVAPLELELHERRQQRRDLGDDAPLVGLAPASRAPRSRRRRCPPRAASRRARASSRHISSSTSRPRRVTSLAACTSAKRVSLPPAPR